MGRDNNISAYEIGEFYNKAVSAVHLESKKSCLLLLEKLSETLPLKALSFYSYSSHQRSFVLKAQVGLDYGQYKSFEREIGTSLAMRRLQKGQVVVDNIRSSNANQESDLAYKYGLKRRLVVPLLSQSENETGTLTNEDSGYRFYVANLIYAYTDSERNLEELRQILEELAPYIRTVYAASVREDKILLRHRIVQRSMFSKDLNSFFHRTIKVFVEYLNIEAASVFLWHARSNLLKLCATTGLDTDIKKPDIFYRPDEESMTVDVAKSGKLNVNSNVENSNIVTKEEKFVETISGKRTSYIYIPVLDWSSEDPPSAKPLGVLRAINRQTKLGKRNQNVSFTWEDVSILRFGTEIMGAVTNLLMKSQQRMEDFENIMHGAKANIEAVIQNLSHFERRPELIEINDGHLQYVLPDSMSLMLDLKWQVERIESHDREITSDLEEVRIVGDVLSKIVSLAKKICKSYNVKKFECTNLKEYGFMRIPLVEGNVEALLTVFRNLIENALKYSNPEKDVCKIDLGYKILPKYVDISVADYGIGIPKDSEEWIFVEGFRADNAIRRRPAGSGFGLSQSKDLMQQMGGDLIYSSDFPDTTFVVRMRLWDERRM